MIGGLITGLISLGALAYFLILYFKPDWLS